MINFICKDCGEPLAVPTCQAGQLERCPTCGLTMEVPHESEPTELTEKQKQDLLDSLHHMDIKKRIQAAQKLGVCCGNEVVEPLAQAFRHPDKFLREAVMEAIIRIGDPQGAGQIVRVLGGHWASETIIHEAVRELVRFGRTAQPPLLQILDETNRDMKTYEPKAVRASVMILGRIGDLECIDLLSKMFFRHFDIHVREAAAAALVQIATPDKWDEIKDLTGDHLYEATRQAAKAVLRNPPHP